MLLSDYQLSDILFKTIKYKNRCFYVTGFTQRAVKVLIGDSTETVWVPRIYLRMIKGKPRFKGISWKLNKKTIDAGVNSGHSDTMNVGIKP